MFLFGIMLIFQIFMDDTPAWMVCTDLLNKIKSELVTEAMEELDSQVAKKNIDIKGALITLPERPEETDMKMFVIRKLVSEAGKIREMYAEAAMSDNDSREVERRERSRIFLLGVERIVLLMHYESMIDSWSYDVGRMVGAKNAVEIIRDTAESAERKDLVWFVLRNKTMIRENALTGDERSILEGAVMQ